MRKLGSTVYVLCWVPGTQGMTWCPVTVVQEYTAQYGVEFHDGSGTGYFPKDEVYDQPDLKLSKQVQKL